MIILLMIILTVSGHIGELLPVLAVLAVSGQIRELLPVLSVTGLPAIPALLTAGHLPAVPAVIAAALSGYYRRGCGCIRSGRIFRGDGPAEEA